MSICSSVCISDISQLSSSLMYISSLSPLVLIKILPYIIHFIFLTFAIFLFLYTYVDIISKTTQPKKLRI